MLEQEHPYECGTGQGLAVCWALDPAHCLKIFSLKSPKDFSTQRLDAHSISNPRAENLSQHLAVFLQTVVRHGQMTQLGRSHFTRADAYRWAGENLIMGLSPSTLPEHRKQPGTGFAGVRQRPAPGGGCVFLCEGTKCQARGSRAGDELPGGM